MNDVPKIQVNGGRVSSTSKVPMDTCACWSPKDRRAATKLLKQETQIICLDQTAWMAMIALSFDLLSRGQNVTATLKKGWQS